MIAFWDNRSHKPDHSKLPRERNPRAIMNCCKGNGDAL